MVDIYKLSYRAVVIDENGNQYDISDYIQDLGWEENENEISVRSSFTARNDETSKGKLSSLIKPGCLVGIFANDGTKDDEVARGFVTIWNPQLRNTSDDLKATNYDVLYDMQKSQDNRYYASGTGTSSIVTELLNDYSIPTQGYTGPNATHAKLKYSATYVSDIILDVLDDAHKKGEAKCILRATKGYAEIVKRGSNGTVYVFQVDNSISVSHSISTAELITRVRVIGQADDDGKSSVEATINGLTQYGIKQRIYTRDEDESLEDAKSAAEEIINEEGIIRDEITVQSPDVPFIRKGDIVRLMAGVSQGDYYVKGIRHDCDSLTMTMDLETTKTGSFSGGEDTPKTEYNIGDIVDFHGGTHYTNSYPDAKGYKATAGKAKITIKNGAGKEHPWHLIHIDSGSNVYGWVDDGTFS